MENFKPENGMIINVGNEKFVPNHLLDPPQTMVWLEIIDGM